MDEAIEFIMIIEKKRYFKDYYDDAGSKCIWLMMMRQYFQTFRGYEVY